MRGPVRTCVGCRAAVAQSELVRIAVVDGRAVADPRRRLPGRGAYLHARPACVAAGGKGLARSLRRAVAKDELDGLRRALLAGGDPGSAVTDGRSTVADAARGRDGRAKGAAADPGVIPSGQRGREAVEIGSPSSTRSMSTRPTSLHDDLHSTGRATTSVEDAERSRQGSDDAIAETITEQ